MSLFKAREYWSTVCGSGEEFDGNCICVGNVDNDPEERMKILTGSLQGMLRIYMPRQREYRPEDLLYEQELEQAILQIEVGRFSTAGGMQLAVLHPRKLVVFTVQNMGSQFLQVDKLYEHHMQHTAANMCYGTFGAQKGCDHICVQSYDGQLSFFEAELFAFSRYLPGFLMPGPLAYVEASDMLVTCGAGLELEAYKYKSLAAATADKQQQHEANLLGPGGGTAGSAAGAAAGMQAGKRVAADWRTVLGEAAVDICAGKLSAGLQSYQADVVVVCEHHVYVVSSQTGQVVFQKRLEYHPAAATLYPAPGAKLPGGADNLLVATHSKTLAVYRANVLCWSARLDHQPVAVRVATLGRPAIQGMIVSLDEAGQLMVSYLGSDPMTNPVGWVEGPNPDYESMGREQRALANLIREHAAGRRVAPPDKLVLRAQVPSVLDHVRGAGAMGSGLHELGSAHSRATQLRLTGRLLISYQGGGFSSADNVRVCVKVPAPVGVEPTTVVLPSVGTDASAPAVVPLLLSPASALHVPCGNSMMVTASFATASGGEPRAQCLEVHLPLCLFATLVPPIKNAAFKVTVSTNRAAPQLSALFEDMMAQAPPSTASAYNAAGANVMSFQLATGADCTILVSKNVGRYRLQSDKLEAMWLFLWELIQRLEAYYQAADANDPSGGSAEQGGLQWSSDEPLPLQDVLEVVDLHWSYRLHVRELRETLEQRAAAMRAIQKRLLLRFKDKNPAPLNQLDVLLEDTYTALQAAGTEMETTQARLKQQGVKLSAVLQLLVLLCKVKFALTPEEASVLRGALCVDVTELEDGGAPDVGWEEVVEAACTQLLRTCLARSAKEAAVSLGTSLTPGTDTVKLKKLLALVCERLSKGMRLTAGNTNGPDVSPGDAGNAAAGAGGPVLARQASKQASTRLQPLAL